MIDVVFPAVSISIRFFQFIHDGVNFFCFHILGWLLLDILGYIQSNVAVDVGSSVGLNLEAFGWIFGHGEGIFVQFEVVST